jgi:uncharacterized Fe-S cluster protein YjdI
MEKITKKYTNGEITVVWKPHLCIHAGACFTELPKVFIPYERPWVKMDAASTQEIINTVNSCPTDALTYYMNAEGEAGKNKDAVPNVQITLLKDGPAIVKGTIKLIDVDGNEIVTEETSSLCRCGASRNKPFCDGSHIQIDFND